MSKWGLPLFVWLCAISLSPLANATSTQAAHQKTKRTAQQQDINTTTQNPELQAALNDEVSPDQLSYKLGPFDVNVNGFLSAGVGISDASPVPTLAFPFTPATPTFRGIGRDPNWNAYTLGGIQFDVPITQQLSVITQLVSRGTNNYNIKTEWAYLKFQATPNLIVQAGRIRVPAFLFSDTLDVGYTYPWITPPAEVYGQIPIPNTNGAQLIYTTEIKGFDIEVQPFMGQDSPTVRNLNSTVTRVKTRNVYGGEVSVSRGPVLVRASYLQANISLPLPSFLFPTPVGVVPITLPPVNDTHASFTGLGTQINVHKFLILSEYTWRHVKGFLPDTEGWYVLVGYHINPSIMPYLSYADSRSTDKQNRNVTAIPAANNLFRMLFDTDQDTIEAGLRLDVQNGLAIKASYQRIRPKAGTRGFFSLMPGAPGRAVNFFNVAVQAVF